jgi:hypothetical protein
MQIQIQGKRRVQALGALLLYFLAVCVFIYILIRTPENSNLALNGLFNYIVFGTILLILLHFIVSTVMDAGKEWLVGPGGLIIDDEKLINTLSFTSTSIVPINEIATTEIKKYKDQEFLLIHLKDQGMLLDRRNSYFQSMSFLMTVWKRACTR